MFCKTSLKKVVAFFNDKVLPDFACFCAFHGVVTFVGGLLLCGSAVTLNEHSKTVMDIGQHFVCIAVVSFLIAMALQCRCDTIRFKAV